MNRLYTLKKYKGYRICGNDHSFTGDLEIYDRDRVFCRSAQSMETAKRLIDEWEKLKKQDLNS